MDQDIYESTPPDPGDEILLAAFHEEIIKQSVRLDEVAKEMLKLELGVPGIYAVALTLLAGKNAVIAVYWLAAVFICWLLALCLTFIALFPQRYEVLEDTPRRVTPAKETGKALTIQEYYQESAKHKRYMLACAAAFFFLGTIMAVISIFAGNQ